MAKAENSKHPSGLYICGMTVAWERFSFYGVKSVLILFLATQIIKGGFGLSKADAASLVSTYAALTYLAPVIGGWICDRYLGARYCVVLGTLLMAAGNFVLFLNQGKFGVYVMIILVTIGTGFFKGNLNTMVGLLYDQNDSRKDGAFSIMYSFTNIGAMFGPLLFGLFADQIFSTKINGEIAHYGYKAVFLGGAIACLLSGLSFALGVKKTMGDSGKIAAAKLTPATTGADNKKQSTAPLTKAEKNRTIVIFVLTFFSIFFWTAYNQASTSIALYTRDFIDMSIGSFTMPVPWLDSFNGFMCVILGPIMSALWIKLEKSKRGDLNITQKMALGFVLLAVGFVFMIFAVLQRGGSADPAIKASVIWVLLFYVLQTTGEMCFSPIGNSMVNRLAPPKYASVLMGVWFLSTFAANKLAGYGQAFIDKLGPLQVFIAIPVALIANAIIIFALNRKLTNMAEQFD
ncbi:amino acid transporter [Clostridium botulinum A2 117]|uniref:Peptide MFS transporter n=1 Tax=Clostridium botulinum TaxID=1491 RepID=A0AA44BRB6_CLOBO|nr:peptide MFS transporter [Clostridium botulinum]KEI78628.1 amino acid transporter [Clostridium botulinum A2 117]MBN3415837.1 MFS transporter [Clostridium botulinum]MBN3442129.1 MFS transporter [Clostridium botulinum]MBY6806178.1 peptide MFS transporter [Clostridium botulinum]NFI06673.1 peptide MFS transporter [Clostridium botulinum]